jgi:glycosidase
MREAMRQAMIYWVKEVNIDGYRIDKAYTVPQEFYNNTITALKEVKPLFFIGDTGIYNQGGLELVSKFDATYDWSGYLISKDIAQGKRKAYDYSRHINKTIKRYDADNTLVNFISNHSENSWNGTVKESYGNADHTFMALNFTTPGMPLVYSGQEYDLNKRLHFFEKDSFPKKVGKTMHLIQQLGALKNNHRALASGKKRGSYKKVQTSKTNQIYAFERGKDGDTLVVIANLSKEYAQFTMPLNGMYRRYQDYKTKQLSSTYQYYLKPWEFWILIK